MKLQRKIARYKVTLNQRDIEGLARFFIDAENHQIWTEAARHLRDYIIKQSEYQVKHDTPSEGGEKQRAVHGIDTNPEDQVLIKAGYTGVFREHYHPGAPGRQKSQIVDTPSEGGK